MKKEHNANGAPALLAWLETPEGRQWAAGFDYFLFMLNDSRDKAERQRAREALKRMSEHVPKGSFIDITNELYIYIAEQRML